MCDQVIGLTKICRYYSGKIFGVKVMVIFGLCNDQFKFWSYLKRFVSNKYFQSTKKELINEKKELDTRSSNENNNTVRFNKLDLMNKSFRNYWTFKFFEFHCFHIIKSLCMIFLGIKLL